MFENVLGQQAADQLIRDIRGGALAPAMLFAGPSASGKGTAALELARVISCEAENAPGRASWNCACSACARHRLLIHPDMLCLGPRSFSAEIAASFAAFTREAGNGPARILFVRSLRKLLARFNPVLWDDEPKLKKISSLVNSLEEDLDELDRLLSGADKDREAPEKLAEGMVKDSYKLEAEGMGDNIPIDQIRRAAWWSRLAPSGRGKLLIIENADRMQEKARNSLLKLLEEPPGRANIVLTSSRPGTLLPTIISRLRPYRFNAREAAAEDEVIRRVFRDTVKAVKIDAYLESFLPVSADTLEGLAAFFAASAAYRAALLSKRRGRPLSEEVVLLGKYSAPRAEAAGLGRPCPNSSVLIPVILEKTGRFEIRSLFSRFLTCLLGQVSGSQKSAEPPYLPSVAYNDVWKGSSAWAETAVGAYNLSPGQALEKLFADSSAGMAEL